VLSVTSSTSGSGFYGGLIIGDPPPQSASISQLATAMASFGANLGGGVGDDHPSMLDRQEPVSQLAAGPLPHAG
jgi:hypothetical protein